MEWGDAAWKGQMDGFLHARTLQKDLRQEPLRQVARPAMNTPREDSATFQNEPDTDFTIRAHREWIVGHLEAQRNEAPKHLPLLIGGEALLTDKRAGFDPGRPDHIPYYLSFADAEHIQRALQHAEEASTRWKSVGVHERAELLRRVAAALRHHRGKLIAAMVMDGGKSVHDADAEVSEAIDFAEYYAHSAIALFEQEGLCFTPRGITVVTPPWNFPMAIPLGGVFAALAAGNSVILKPAVETAYIATRAVELCYEAGVPTDVLQLIVAEDEVASELIVNPRVQTVVLTGGTATAELFKKMRPRLHLLAETGGKNASIISRYADRDLAVHSVVESAFGHAGQKCSATSLLIVPPELAEDPTFREQLVDAARSMHVGPGWDLHSKVTTLIHPPAGDLLEGLTRLDEGESWWLKPEPNPNNPRLWTPGIKAGVKAGGFSHQTEFFGPVLSVLTADSVEEALVIANSTDYGLTAGFHSLDEDEVSLFVESMNAGNLYVNRTTTGAIVRRQPFGGRKASSFGPGAKAGGPNYVGQFVHITQQEAPKEGRGDGAAHGLTLLDKALDRWPEWATELACFASAFSAEAQETFFVTEDPNGLRGQDNLFRYQFHTPIALVAFPKAQQLDLIKAGVAMAILGVPFRVACAEPTLQEDLQAVFTGAFYGKDWQELLSSQHYSRLRAFGELTDEQWLYASPLVRVIDNSPALDHPQLEGLKYCVEQSVSMDYHRYGHLGFRELGLDEDASA